MEPLTWHVNNNHPTWNLNPMQIFFSITQTYKKYGHIVEVYLGPWTMNAGYIGRLA